MNTGAVSGAVAWTAVLLGYAASVWTLARAGRGVTCSSDHGGRNGLAVSRPRHRVLRALVGVHSRLRAPRL